jgi:hypothetical protein
MGYNMFEAVASLVAGMLSGSVALVGFGLDSAIELAASGVAQWRLRTDHDERGRAHTDRRSRQMIGWSFVLLAAYIFADSGLALWHRTGSRRTTFGIVVLALSAVVMPLLADHLARRRRGSSGARGSRLLLIGLRVFCGGAGVDDEMGDG